MRDSAGIQIVDVPGALLERLPVWRIAGEPTLSIGEVEGDAPYLFTTIDSEGVAPLPDGQIAIVDGRGTFGSLEIRIFDAQGRFVRKMGKKGEGPGEFRNSPWIKAAPGGGIVSYELGRRRVSRYDDSGALVDGWQTRYPEQCPRQPCSLETGGGVLGNGAVPLSTRESPVLSQAAVGQVYDTLKTWFGLELRDGYREIGSAPWPAMRVLAGQSANGATRFLARTAELASPVPRLVTGHAHVAVVNPARYEISIADAEGRLLRIVRVHRDPIPFTREERDAILAAEAAYVPPVPVTVTRVEGDRPVAEHRPHFGSVNFGEGDDLWVWDYEPTRLAGSGRPERVTIFAIDGTPVARLEARPDPLWRDQSRPPRFGFSTVNSRTQYRVITADPLGVVRLLVFPILK